jgi:hypothetical protein
MSAIILALEAFINLAERIIRVEKIKREDKKQVFKEIIEPLFVQFQPVAENYLEMFRKTRQRVVETPAHELLTAIDEIRELRGKMQFARHETNRMARQMSVMYKDEKILDFSANVERFFLASLYPTDGGLRPTRSEEFVQLFMNVVTRKEDKSVLIQYIDDALESLVAIWNDIAQSYAAAKIYYLSSPELIKKSK